MRLTTLNAIPLLFAAVQVSAGSTYMTSTFAEVCKDEYECQNRGNWQENLLNNGPVFTSTSYTVPSGYLAGFASAYAFYGTLGTAHTLTIETYPEGSFDLDPNGRWWDQLATARWMDTFTITGGTGTGVFRTVFHVSGSQTNSGDARVSSFANFWGTGYYFDLGNGTNSLTVLTPFVYGEPFGFDANLWVGMVINDEPGSGSPLYSYEGSSMYGNTVVLSSAVVLDEFGEPVPTALINSATGIDYTAIPEPATLAGVGLGLVTLAMTRRFGSRHQDGE